MKHKNMKQVSHGFLKKQNSSKIGLRYDHREYFKEPPPCCQVRYTKWI